MGWSQLAHLEALVQGLASLESICGGGIGGSSDGNVKV